MTDSGGASATLREISGLLIRGGLAEGWRVPPERELADRLGASRVTVRQALAALERWGVLAARRGSGVVVRHRREWGLAALPALLRAAGAEAAPVLQPLAVEALALRRAVARRLPGEVAGRLGAGALDPSRRLAAAADAARAETVRLVALDAAALRGVFEAAGAWGSAWLWNDLGGPALALAERLAGPAPVAPDYLARSGELLDALERGDAARAERLLGAHLSRLDRGLLAAFAPAAGAPA
jgi:GntR family transcriptional repressor for pyruvate dehydrogenase complex